MKRLLKISFDLALLSFIPVLSWFALSIIIDERLINIFTLTYPLQFIWYIIRSIFSTGANISGEKDKNENAVMSGIVVGSIVAVIVYGLIAINIENYISFMNMDIEFYKNFAVYSVLQLLIQLIFAFILQKLYFEGKNTKANKYSIFFNAINFVVLIGSSLITKNEIVIISLTLISILLFTIFIAVRNFNKFKFKLNILKCIKYDSVELFNNIAFFFIFLFGLSNALEFGEKYTLAITFIALITDTQWDVFESIIIAAQIDISKKRFNYKEHLKNAYILTGVIISTIFVMFIVLYGFYTLDFKITIIYLSIELMNFAVYPVYTIQTYYLQLEHSATKTTGNKMFANLIRFIISLLPTPFCTGLGQIASAFYQFISVNLIFGKKYKIDKSGEVVKRIKSEG